MMINLMILHMVLYPRVVDIYHIIYVNICMN